MPRAIVAKISVAGGEEVFTARLAALYATKTNEVERLSHAVDHQIRANVKAATLAAKKKKTGKSTTSGTIDESAPDPREIPYAVPTGDEPWVNAETGIIMELDSQDIKALEDHQKSAYAKQILYFQHCSLQSAKQVVAKI